MNELPRGRYAGCAFLAYSPQINSVQIATKNVFGGCEYARTIGRERDTI